jgi:hypothetical protein
MLIGFDKLYKTIKYAICLCIFEFIIKRIYQTMMHIRFCVPNFFKNRDKYLNSSALLPTDLCETRLSGKTVSNSLQLGHMSVNSRIFHLNLAEILLTGISTGNNIYEQNEIDIFLFS